MKINVSFFALFLVAWVIGIVAVNFAWTLIADLALIALIVIYGVRAQVQVSRWRYEEERRQRLRK